MNLLLQMIDMRMMMIIRITMTICMINILGVSVDLLSNCLIIITRLTICVQDLQCLGHHTHICAQDPHKVVRPGFRRPNRAPIGSLVPKRIRSPNQIRLRNQACMPGGHHLGGQRHISNKKLILVGRWEPISKIPIW